MSLSDPLDVELLDPDEDWYEDSSDCYSDAELDAARDQYLERVAELREDITAALHRLALACVARVGPGPGRREQLLRFLEAYVKEVEDFGDACDAAANEHDPDWYCHIWEKSNRRLSKRLAVLLGDLHPRAWEELGVLADPEGVESSFLSGPLYIRRVIAMISFLRRALGIAIRLLLAAELAAERNEQTPGLSLAPSRPERAPPLATDSLAFPIRPHAPTVPGPCLPGRAAALAA